MIENSWFTTTAICNPLNDDDEYSLENSFKGAMKHLMPVKFPEGSLDEELKMNEKFDVRILELFEKTISPNVFEDPQDVLPRDEKNFCTVVFDLDETLVYARGDSYCIRPFTRVLLEFLRSDAKGVEIMVWSAGTRSHVECCLSLLDPSSNIFSYAVCRGEWASPKSQVEGNFKNLGNLKGRCSKTIILFDDSLLASSSNPFGNVIVLPKFEPSLETGNFDSIDVTLFYVIQMVAWLHMTIFRESGEPFLIREQISNHPFVIEKIERRQYSIRERRVPHLVLDIHDFVDLEKRVLWWKAGGII